MATADYWSAADLDALATGGLINESVMSRIWDISNIPLPFTDLVGYGEPITATPHSWTQDAQAAPDITNAVVDGADAGANNAAGGSRVQNHAQICEKVVEVTERAIASDTIGRANEYAYQIAMRQRDNRRDIEAIALTGQASVADNGDAVAGQSAGFAAWLTTNNDLGATGAVPGYQSGTGLVTAVTDGTPRALSVATLGSMVESVYLANGNVTTLMSRPELTRRLNDYILANPTAFGIATPTANVGGGPGSGTPMVAQGFINVLVTNFNTVLEVVPNRIYQEYGTNDCDLFLIDPAMVEFTNLIGEHTSPLAKLGTADRGQITQQWMLRVMDEAAHAQIRDLSDDAAVVA